ncbi:hypothetical protein [Gryllotalpicola koreensis]|uniref:DUF559 domain-containing protein n=1 Tax=Gryllotalpicola koreensis TaxID=993086 RepID=A0ABP7ZXX5_9MICO
MQTPLCALGHIASLAELRRRGFGPREIAALRTNPLCYQPRRGWYACAHLSSDEMVAVSCSGRIDCASALRADKIWVGDVKGHLHLRLPGTGGRTTQRLRATRRRVVAHWLRPRRRGDKLYVSVFDALRQAMDCLPPDDLIAAIESAVHLTKLTKEAALELIASAPKRLRKVLREVDTEFRAQSGLETKVRLRFTRLGYHVEPQAYVPGVGHVDNLIENIIALETNGRDHEDSRSDDYYRDLGTEAWGIRVLIADPALIDEHWSVIQGVVERTIAEVRQLRALNGRDLDGAPRKARRHADRAPESLPLGVRWAARPESEPPQLLGRQGSDGPPPPAVPPSRPSRPSGLRRR